MSSAIDPLTLDANLAPRRIPTLTSASIALRTAKQGQFQSITPTTAIFTAPGGNVLRVQCIPANIHGKADPLSPVTILVHSAQNVLKPSAAAVGTLPHAEADGVDATVTVLPDPANGRIDISFTLTGPDATCRATLRHRFYAASSVVDVT